MEIIFKKRNQIHETDTYVFIYFEDLKYRFSKIKNHWECIDNKPILEEVLTELNSLLKTHNS